MTQTAAQTSIPGSQTTYQLTGKTEIVFERTYDATPPQVFAAFCDPKRVAQWWGSAGATLEIESWDVRVGGSWRILETDAKGKTSIFHGTYAEVTAPNRVVATLCYGDGFLAKNFAIDETYEFVATGNKTTLRLTSKYPMGFALKGMLSVGMDTPGKNTDGSRHQWRLDRLAALLGKKVA